MQLAISIMLITARYFPPSRIYIVVPVCFCKNPLDFQSVLFCFVLFLMSFSQEIFTARLAENKKHQKSCIWGGQLDEIRVEPLNFRLTRFAEDIFYLVVFDVVSQYKNIYSQENIYITDNIFMNCLVESLLKTKGNT